MLKLNQNKLKKMALKQVFYFIHLLILCFAIANSIEVKFHVGNKCGNNAECVWNIAGKGKNDFLKCEKNTDCL